jgi:hypothetical protein
MLLGYQNSCFYLGSYLLLGCVIIFPYLIDECLCKVSAVSLVGFQIWAIDNVMEKNANLQNNFINLT